MRGRERGDMKSGIHPKYTEIQVTCSCGNTFATRRPWASRCTSKSARRAIRSTPASRRSWTPPAASTSSASATASKTAPRRAERRSRRRVRACQRAPTGAVCASTVKAASAAFFVSDPAVRGKASTTPHRLRHASTADATIPEADDPRPSSPSGPFRALEAVRPRGAVRGVGRCSASSATIPGRRRTRRRSASRSR